MRFVVRAGLVSVLLLSLAVVACRGFSLRQQRVTNEAKPTHPKTALLNVDSSVHRHKEKEPAVIGADPAVPGVVDTSSATGGLAGLGNSGAFDDEVAPPPSVAAPPAARVVEEAPTSHANMAARPAQEIVSMPASEAAPAREYDDTDTDASEMMAEGSDDPSEPKETITREDIMTTTANRQYKAAVQKLRKQEQEKNEVAAKVDEAEAAQIVAPPPLVPLASRVVPQPPSVALPAAQVAKVPPAPPRPVASLAAASATVSTVAQEAAKASAAAKTASISPGVTRPKGWDQC